ncbi:MAG TPA: radical SAM/SPASM domain-containing protein [Vicinamibacterales bacterium]|nr:radical SAM/SPASM domain-containing protein [Vicinamibacterales bacterium]
MRLRLALPTAAHEVPLHVRTSAPLAFGPGFHEVERDALDEFRWMRSSARLGFAPSEAARFLELWALSEFEDLSQELEVVCGGVVTRFQLVAGWGPLSIAVPGGASGAVLEVNKPFPRAYYPGDTRELAIRVRGALLHADAARHAHIARQHGNAVRNTREMLDGRAVLESTPPTLGIDLYGKCNVKPPCVYCDWDHNKELEGARVDAPFTVDTLKEWGAFFDNSLSLINCSIGEPFMMKNVDELLDAFGNAAKVLEMTTNGQILTDRNIQRLLGRPIDLYVSLDAATPDTYAKLRNQRFDAILENLRRLIEAKGGPGALPRVHLVFMPMRVNVHEADAFVRLCADLRVDRLVLRPLNYSDDPILDWERAGYRFKYEEELLPFEELVRVSGRVAALCERLGVALSDQMNFGGSLGEQFDVLFEEGRRSVEAEYVFAAPAPAQGALLAAALPAEAVPAPAALPAVAPEMLPAVPITPAELPSLGGERKPACTEPWKSLYILRRGVFPCCYGGRPIDTMENYREAWNSRAVQHIRAELAAGRFPAYCLRSTSCPIVRRSHQGDALPPAQAAYMRARRIWARFNRLTDDRAVKMYAAVKRTGVRARRALTERGYASSRLRRLLRR